MTDTSVVDPKVAPAAAGPAASAANPDASAAAAASAPAPAVAEPAKPVNPNSPKWALDRISEETRARREAEARAAEAAERANNAEALLRRMQTTGTAGANADPAPAASRVPPAAPTADPAAVRQAAEQLRFQEDINSVIAAGISEFGQDSFHATSRTLDALGATDEFLADVLAVDKANAHKMFAKIAAEPEQAARLARLPSRQRIAELTRLSVAQGAPAVTADPPKPAAPAATVSKAPAPAPAIQTGTTATTEKHWWDDGIDGAECDQIFFDQKRLEQRAGRARR